MPTCSEVGLLGGPRDPTSVCVEGLGPLPGFPREPRRVPGFNSFADKCTLPELGDPVAQDKELRARPNAPKEHRKVPGLWPATYNLVPKPGGPLSPSQLHPPQPAVKGR